MSVEFEEKVIEELSRLNSKIDNVDQRLDNVDQRLDNVDQRLDNVDQRLDEVNHRIDTELKDIRHSIEIMNQSIVLLEHKLTFEVPALFDGYAMSRDMQEIQHSRLNSLSIKVEDLDNRISILEQKTS